MTNDNPFHIEDFSPVVGILGDTHGNFAYTVNVLEYLKRLDVDTVLQVGDFGYFPHLDSGQKFLTELSNVLELYDINLYWLRGNHDNIDDIADQGWTKATSSVRMASHLHYLPMASLRNSNI